MQRDVAYDVVAHAAKATFSNLPESTVSISKKFVLDTIGVAIAGSAAPGCGEVASYIKEIGGKQESTVLMFGHKVPNFHAAFVNGMMCHALDFDDTHEGALVHANVTILPAALATAESVGGISGKDFLLAYALGVDFACRVGLATGLKQGWHYTSVCGYFGSALTSSKILGLNEREMLNALGIAYSQVGGTHQTILDTALVKRMHPGLAARGGVFSAMLAKQGITGSKGIFEGEFGFFNKYERGNADILRKDLGKTFEVDNLSLKPYPCCMCTHGAITGTLDLVKEHNIQPDDVEKVEVITSRYVNGLIGAPFEIRDNPQVDAQFSGPYTVAAAIIRGKFGIGEIQEDSIRDSQIMALAERVSCSVDDSIKTYLVPVTVKIHLRNGGSISKRVEVLKGNPANPTTEEEDIEKFNECARFGIREMSEGRRDKLVELILSLEELSNVQEIVEYLR
jgi:2-methylcitrate dehydratase PrpD